MSSEDTPTAATYAEEPQVPSVDEKSTKPENPDIQRLRPEIHTKPAPSSPDSMNVEVGSEATTEPEANERKFVFKGTEPEKPADTESDGSWEQVKHEGVEERPSGEDKKDEFPATEVEDEIAPEFRPRTPRPYGGHGN